MAFLRVFRARLRPVLGLYDRTIYNNHLCADANLNFLADDRRDLCAEQFDGTH